MRKILNMLLVVFMLSGCAANFATSQKQQAREQTTTTDTPEDFEGEILIKREFEGNPGTSW